MSNDDMSQARKDLLHSEADLYYFIEVFGDHIGKKNGYQLSGMEAVYLYLIEKHHWTPSQVKSMSKEDLYLTLTQEINALSKAR